MSNQPPPTPPADWQPPQIPYGTPQSSYNYRPTSSAARTAGVVQIVLGSLALLLSFCLLGGLAIVDSSMLTPQQQAELDRLGVELDGAMQIMFIVAGACMALPGIAYIILGAFVWRGAKVAVVISLVMTGLLMLLNLIGLASSVLSGAVGLEELCPSIAMLGALVGLAALLAWAWRDLKRVQAGPAYGQWPTAYEGQVYPGHPGSLPPVPPQQPQWPEDLPPPPVPPK